MKYRHKFIDKLRKEFPDCSLLPILLEDGSIYLGEYLKKKTSLKLDPEEVVSAFRAGRQHIIKEKAETALRAQRLYDEWHIQYKRAVDNGKAHRFECYSVIV